MDTYSIEKYVYFIVVDTYTVHCLGFIILVLYCATTKIHQWIVSNNFFFLFKNAKTPKNLEIVEERDESDPDEYVLKEIVPIKRAEEALATYNKRSSQVSRMSKGNKSLVLTEKNSRIQYR